MSMIAPTTFACEDHEKITMVSAGEYHSLALKSDGTVWAWGNNDHGELGNGTKVDSLSPVQVIDLEGVKKIDAGSATFSLALKNDGTVWAWGDNSMRQIGTKEMSTDYTVPTQIEELTDIIDIATGAQFGLALQSDGKVWAWGANTAGALGNGTSVTNTEIPVSSSIDNVKQIAAGQFSAYALKNDGTVWAWGDNQYGQLGLGKTPYSTNVPTQIPGLENIIAISAGYQYALALKNDGTVWAWGDNGEGQLGNGTVGSEYTPVQVANLTDVVDIEAGRRHSFARKADGTVWAWGDNGGGQFGNGTTTDSKVPVEITNLDGFTQVSAGNGFSLGVKSDGTAWGWGGNNWGQIGDGTTSYKKLPVAITGM